MPLSSAECDDPSNRVVRRDSHRDAIAGDDLDAEAAHPAAELGQDFVTGIALHAVKTPAVHRDDGALHIDQIVLAQTASVPFLRTNIVPQIEWRVVVGWWLVGQSLRTASSTCRARA